MTFSKVVRLTICLGAASLSAGCVGPNFVAENNPRWLRAEVTGSRILRPRNAQGSAEAGDYVTKGDVPDFLILPWVSIY
ncbi:hypothetical protein HNQ60_005452 [Povalibacter uvarum]|uniref:Uncharacterized protein n=1 Tax=Povalibacter uvarum TaxID=732238 RepID=A0A841HWE8_9GAMM|nr:hypothetical protein [Povalibacter uvarum]MBB6096530.1 hypothetical protein [Povalibacter uvarum]